jgi:hypothetical protein
MGANLVLQNWANEQPRLWDLVKTTFTLTQGQQTITLPSTCVMVTDVYVTTISGSVSTDRIMTQIGRSDYAAYPNKADQGVPNVFWFNRLATPSLVLWPTPDGTTTYTITVYYFGVDQDVTLAGSDGLDVPNRLLMAFVDALTVEMALMYAPERVTVFAAKAAQSKELANNQDTERVTLYVSPVTAAYWR